MVREQDYWKYIVHGVNIVQVTSQGYYNLHKTYVNQNVGNAQTISKAITHGHLRLVTMLSPYCEMSYNYIYSFNLACRYGYLDVVKFLSNYIVLFDGDGYIGTAVRTGQYNVVEYLMRKVQYDNLKYMFITALNSGWYKVAMYILSKDDTINCKDEDVVRCAVRHNMFSLLNRIVRSGYNILNTSPELLLDSVREYNPEMVSFLYRTCPLNDRPALRIPYLDGRVSVHHQCLICAIQSCDIDLIQAVFDNSTSDDLLKMNIVLIVVGTNDKDVINLFQSYISQYTSTTSIKRIFLRLYSMFL
jgi:hypothetical protein